MISHNCAHPVDPQRTGTSLGLKMEQGRASAVEPFVYPTAISDERLDYYFDFGLLS